jgi:hypothetical protein
MGRTGKSFALLLAVLFLTSFIVTHATVKAQTRTLVVPDQYPTIQAAIDAANIGDTVFVKAGTYDIYAQVNRADLFINKPIALEGENAKTTVINTGLSDGFCTGISTNAVNVTVSGFTINNNGKAIVISSGSANISGNIINLTGDGSAISATQVDVQIISNTINGDSQSRTSNGLYLQGGQYLISNNLISGFHVGILSTTNNALILNNTMCNNQLGFTPFSSDGSFSYNNIFNNSEFSVFSRTADIDATYNWWGTSDSDAINQTIAHYVNNPYPPNPVELGIVTFVPYLNEANKQATPYSFVSTPTPSVSEFPAMTILPWLLSVFSVALLVRYRKVAHG